MATKDQQKISGSAAERQVIAEFYFPGALEAHEPASAGGVVTFESGDYSQAS